MLHLIMKRNTSLTFLTCLWQKIEECIINSITYDKLKGRDSDGIRAGWSGLDSLQCKILLHCNQTGFEVNPDSGPMGAGDKVAGA